MRHRRNYTGGKLTHSKPGETAGDKPVLTAAMIPEEAR